MRNIDLLLKDKQFLTDLLNGPCRPYRVDENPMEIIVTTDGRLQLNPKLYFLPFEADQIDEEGSEKITAVYRNLLPEDVPLISRVVVVRGTRLRYIVVTVIPDTVIPDTVIPDTVIPDTVIPEYGYQEDLICNAISCLDMWEESRVKSGITAKSWLKEPSPDIDLMPAHIEWCNLYVGAEPVDWTLINFYDLRRMDDLTCRKLLEEMPYLEHCRGGGKERQNDVVC